MPHIVTTSQTAPGAEAKPVVVQIPDDKDPFEVMALIQKRMFPGASFAASDKAFARIMAARAEAPAPPAREPSERLGGATNFPRRWQPQAEDLLDPEEKIEENLHHTIPDDERPEAEAARPEAPEQRKQLQEEPSDPPPAYQIPAAASEASRTLPSSPFLQSAPSLAAGASPSNPDADEPEGRVPHSTSVTPSSGVRDSSLSAYRALQWSGKLAAQEQQVVDVFLKRPSRYTRQEIARETGLGINAVCGRVNSLLKEPFNVLLENGKKECSVTGNSVNALELAREASNQENP